jgi:ABC-type bacteriocin/lantibiotic exporter with double-glycine peptidase domain
MPYWKLIILITATILLSKTMTTLVSKCTDGVYYSGSMNQLNTFLEKFHYQGAASTETPHTTQQTDTTSLPPLVTVHNYDIAYTQVAFRYPQSSSPELLFRDVSFTIPYRSNVVILGDIGSGKSTLVKMLLNTYQPLSGTVSIGGVPIDTLTHDKLTSIVTYMNQNVTLFNRTIRENIFYGREPDIPALQQLDIPPKILENLDMVVGKNANNLSGGEKQIILLLRLYFRQVRIVILDEPTSNLDPQTKDHIIGLIQELMKSKTVICITHDTSITKFFSRAFMLQNKTLVPY